MSTLMLQMRSANQMTYLLAPSPHAKQPRSTAQVMRIVLYALVPGTLVHYWVFGPGIWFQLLLAIGTALITEALIMHARHRSSRNALKDYTAVVTAVLLALSVPALAPWWIVVIATIAAIGIAKHIYGGVGQNLFNPAMVGYVVVLISFPVQMTSWPLPQSLSQFELSWFDHASVIFTGYSTDGFNLEQLRAGIDGMTMATPLDAMKTGLTQQLLPSEIATGAMFSGLAGTGWQWLNLAFLAGGIALLWTRVISWHIPVGVLVGMTVPALLLQMFMPDQSIPLSIHWFSGATMLGAFFIATDPVSAATSPRGRWYYGLLIGALVVVIRAWGGYPDGMAFAVLLANLSVPLIDRYTRPQVYGHRGDA